MILRFDSSLAAPPQLSGALTWDGGGREWTAICEGPDDQLQAAATAIGARFVAHRALSLDEIFMARSGATAGLKNEE